MGRSLLSAHRNRKATPDDSCLSPIRLYGREEKYLHISKDCATFAAVFEAISQRIYIIIMCSVHLHTGITAGQKRANFSASFNADCLVVSQEFATLHTQCSHLL